MLADITSLLLGCVPIFSLREPGAFRITVLVGILLGALCWYLCSVYTRLWNRRFRITLTHHVLCGFASICTVAFTILFASLYYTKDAALVSIKVWQGQLERDHSWNERTYAKAYDKVKDLGIEDFSSAPPPGVPGSIIPTSNDESRQTVASLYANEACKHFANKRPFLSKVVWSSPGVPSDRVLDDVREWQRNTMKIYPLTRAVDIAATQIRDGLVPQVPRVIYLSRLAVAVAFFLIQLIPFGLIGWAAYRDIKVKY